MIADLEQCATIPLPLADDSIDELLLSHVLEHIEKPLPLMQELWRVAKPGSRLVARTPYGSSDGAFEDPTHVRQLFLQSFGFFSQPYYWRADYGYRGDWMAERITLFVGKGGNESLTADQILQKVMTLRNVVQEMVAELICIKPPREPIRELLTPPAINVHLL